MRRPVIVANWKMFKTGVETRAFFEALKVLVQDSRHCDIVVAPPFTALATATEAVKGTTIAIGAQDAHWEKDGAFTGEVSMKMLLDAGCAYVIVGHSERRHLFGETNENVSRKAKAALAAGLTPIVCVGETLAQRERNETRAVIEQQFNEGLAALIPEEFSRILMAYEPIWAIGTGRTATPELAAETHRLIRERAAAKFSAEQASQLRLLYGGSVKPDNIRGLMAQVEIDGALVGGASLDPHSFAAIVNF